ncbi:MAG: hypothetical protein ABI361_11270 [Nitrososphaera sp.]|jgi:hypothetical protein
MTRCQCDECRSPEDIIEELSPTRRAKLFRIDTVENAYETA